MQIVDNISELNESSKKPIKNIFLSEENNTSDENFSYDNIVFPIKSDFFSKDQVFYLISDLTTPIRSHSGEYQEVDFSIDRYLLNCEFNIHTNVSLFIHIK